MKYLIVNADDFGASSGINRGILEAHRRGIVTSASLMVNMPAAEEAVLLSREVPQLSVGLHVNFTNEGENPVVDLSDAEACREELQRQFERFQKLVGRLPTHLDSHQNVHRRPHLLLRVLGERSRQSAQHLHGDQESALGALDDVQPDLGDQREQGCARGEHGPDVA